MRDSRDLRSGRRREGPRPHKRPIAPGGMAQKRWTGSPKSGHRLPLPGKAGGPIETKRGARGYKRPTGRVPLPEDEEGIEALERAGTRGREAEEDEQLASLPRYEILDHTADLGIRVTADTPEHLFENAGLSLMDLLTDLSRVRPSARFEFSLSAENLEELFVRWLRELIYKFFGEKLAFCRFEIAGLTQGSLSVACWGEHVDPRRHVFRTEIKAVTYHELKVERSDSGWTAEVIFDV